MSAAAHAPGAVQMDTSPLGMRVQLGAKSWGRVASYRLLENGRLLAYCQPDDASEGQVSVPVLVSIRQMALPRHPPLWMSRPR